MSKTFSWMLEGSGSEATLLLGAGGIVTQLLLLLLCYWVLRKSHGLVGAGLVGAGFSFHRTLNILLSKLEALYSILKKGGVGPQLIIALLLRFQRLAQIPKDRVTKTKFLEASLREKVIQGPFW